MAITSGSSLLKLVTISLRNSISYGYKFCPKRIGRLGPLGRKYNKPVVLICCGLLLLFVSSNWNYISKQNGDRDVELQRLLRGLFNETLLSENRLWRGYEQDEQATVTAEEKFPEMKKYIQNYENFYPSLLGYNNGSGNGCYLRNGTRVFDKCCPLIPYRWSTCHILFVAQAYQKTRKDRPAYFLINNEYVPTDIAEDGIHILLLSNSCAIEYSTYFSDINVAEVAISFIPENTILVGVAVGVFGRLLPKQLGYTLKFQVRNSVITFSTIKGVEADSDFEALWKYGGRREVFRSVHYGIKQSVNVTSVPMRSTMKHDESVDFNKDVLWYPSHCNPRWKVAIVIPYRNRETHLNIFLQNMVPFLRKQMVSYTIIVVEQAGQTAFNRASLMNIGFLIGQKLSHFDCYVFHDVDLIPEDLTNLYACAEMPRHLAARRNSTKYRLEYREYFGGASMLRPEHILKFNGFSNKFFGWGGEDDNIYMRCITAGLNVTRFPKEVARYTMLSHSEESENPHMNRSFHLRWTHKQNRMSSDIQIQNMTQLLNYTKTSANISSEIWSTEFQPASDGLHLVQYTLLSLEKKPFYVKAQVKIPGPDYKDLICKDRSKVAKPPPKLAKSLAELCNSVKKP